MVTDHCVAPHSFQSAHVGRISFLFSQLCEVDTEGITIIPLLLMR